VTVVLVTLVALLLAAAIAIQLYYLRGLAKAGVEITRSTKVLSYFNIGLLAVLLVVLLLAAFTGRLPIMARG